MATTAAKIIPIYVEDEMRNSYIDYSMSVIVSRALPDVRDGLKPVHRRVLVAMRELNLLHDRPFRKSAKITGDVTGNYHPHGTVAVYETMVRLAQYFSMRYPLVDGQGNFGSVDGDAPAAERYTEARLTEFAEEMLRDIEKNTVDLRPNYDETREEPVVLPSAVPNLLVNGSLGHRGRHGDQHPAAQPPRDRRRDPPRHRRSRVPDRGPAPDRSGSRFPDRRRDLRPPGDQRLLHHRPRPHHGARARDDRGGQEGPAGDHRHRDPLQVNKAALLEKIADLVKRGRSTASRTSATSRTAKGCGSSSS